MGGPDHQCGFFIAIMGPPAGKSTMLNIRLPDRPTAGRYFWAEDVSRMSDDLSEVRGRRSGLYFNPTTSSRN
jgi:ABC-type lipoprotein export system ATPase subunit